MKYPTNRDHFCDICEPAFVRCTAKAEYGVCPAEPLEPDYAKFQPGALRLMCCRKHIPQAVLPTGPWILLYLYDGEGPEG